MATCPECDADIDVDEYDVDKGDIIQLPGVREQPRSHLASRPSSSTSRPKRTRTSWTRTRPTKTTRKKRKRIGTSDVSSRRQSGRGQRRDRLERKEQRLREILAGLRLGDRRVQRRRRQRVPGGGRRRGARRPRAVRHGRQPQLPGAPPRAGRCGSPREFQPAPRVPPDRRRWSGPSTRANPSNRCYYCKQELFGRLTALARERGFAAVVDGNNADDRGDYRPGRQAAREFGVRSPLDEAGLTKAEIRELSRRLGLPTWDEPASACLSSRIPYNSTVTVEKLRMIEQAEEVLHSPRLPRTAASATTATWRGSSSRRRDLPRALERRRARRDIVRRSEGDRLPLRQRRPRRGTGRAA